MKKITLTTCAILVMVLFSAKATAQSTETRNLSGFTDIRFGVPGNLNIRIGSEFKVVLEGNTDFLSEIETNVSNGILSVRRKDTENRRRWRGSLFNNEKVTINITMPIISGLSVAGSGTAEVFDSFNTGSLNFTVSGSGQIIVNDVSCEKLSCSVSGSGNIIINSVSGKDLTCRISGSGNITAKGSGSFNKADIGISGSGNYTGESLKLEAANISIAGSGNCNCNVINSLEARVSGSGNVIYTGNPPKIDSRTTGSGRVRSK
jgi:hypothetical protein